MLSRTTSALILFLATGAWAAPSPDVRKYLASATALFENLDYESALAQLNKAKPHSKGPEDDAAIALYEGTVRVEMGDDRALSLFILALGLDPKAQLPMVVSPKVQRLFNQARASVNRYTKPPPEDVPIPPTTPPSFETPQDAPVKETSRPPPIAVAAEHPAPASGGGVRRIAWIPGALGLVVAGVGVVLLIEANSIHGSLISGGPADPSSALAQVSMGKTFQTAGWALTAIGGAAIVTALVLFVSGGPSDSGVSAAAFITPRGAHAGLTFTLP